MTGQFHINSEGCAKIASLYSVRRQIIKIPRPTTISWNPECLLEIINQQDSWDKGKITSCTIVHIRCMVLRWPATTCVRTLLQHGSTKVATRRKYFRKKLKTSYKITTRRRYISRSPHTTRIAVARLRDWYCRPVTREGESGGSNDPPPPPRGRQ